MMERRGKCTLESSEMQTALLRSPALSLVQLSPRLGGSRPGPGTPGRDSRTCCGSASSGASRYQTGTFPGSPAAGFPAGLVAEQSCITHVPLGSRHCPGTGNNRGARVRLVRIHPPAVPGRLPLQGDICQGVSFTRKKEGTDR